MQKTSPFLYGSHKDYPYTVRTFSEGVKLLNAGELIIYPTETFFALGCAMNSARAINAVFSAKGRALHKPLPLLAASMEQVLAIAHMQKTELALAEAFWPAPLTLLLRAKECVFPSITAGSGRVAVRISAHSVATRLAEQVNVPLVSSSANISGQMPVKSVNELDSKLFPHIRGVIVEGYEPRGIAPSTIVQVNSDDSLSIVRHGAVSVQTLLEMGYVLA